MCVVVSVALSLGGCGVWPVAGSNFSTSVVIGNFGSTANLGGQLEIHIPPNVFQKGSVLNLELIDEFPFIAPSEVRPIETRFKITFSPHNLLSLDSNESIFEIQQSFLLDELQLVDPREDVEAAQINRFVDAFRMKSFFYSFTTPSEPDFLGCGQIRPIFTYDSRDRGPPIVVVTYDELYPNNDAEAFINSHNLITLFGGFYSSLTGSPSPISELYVAPSQVSFSIEAGKRTQGLTGVAPPTFQIKRQGLGLLRWSVFESENWLSISQPLGCQSKTIAVEIDASNLSEGSYSSEIIVKNLNNSKDRETVLIDLAVLPNSGTLQSQWITRFSTAILPHFFLQKGDGSLYAIGSYKDGSDEDIAVLNLDTSGSVIWQKRFSIASDDLLRSVAITSDGGLIFAGSLFRIAPTYSWIAKMSNSGIIEWFKRFEDSDTTIYSIKEVNDGTFVATGRYSPASSTHNFWTAKFDSNGTEIWEKEFQNLNILGRNLQATSDGGFIVLGVSNGFAIAKFDTNGNVEWVKDYTASISSFELGENIQETSDGGFVVSGTAGDEMFLVRLNSSGDISWSKKYGDNSPTVDYRGHSVINDGFDGFILSGRYRDRAPSPDVTEGFLIKIDSDGDIVWQKKLGLINTARHVNLTSNGGFITGGWLSDSYVIKLDSSGDGCNSITSGSATAADFSISESLITVSVASSDTTIDPSAQLQQFDTQIQEEQICSSN